jgi:hypothetical protein
MSIAKVILSKIADKLLLKNLAYKKSRQLIQLPGSIG